MFYLMASIFKKVQTKRQDKPCIILLGIDNAGKSSILTGFTYTFRPPVPTWGFAHSIVEIGKKQVDIYDVGGGKNIRAIWKKYYADVHGIIFVVDSTDSERREEVLEVFEESFSHPFLVGKPILMIFQDQTMRYFGVNNYQFAQES
ncbi:MAG: hypothetical protein EZS28_009705 [Streblomastix strix]|uniref:ADP-ribosylation factor n=1 Tax=Streblomastix strix TaxID=222440 RepID=A0A5J4WIV5_9EUKA|nr:MAG: hypothetical protein EZS28_009705 [Streblomastix strix]